MRKPMAEFAHLRNEQYNNLRAASDADFLKQKKEHAEAEKMLRNLDREIEQLRILSTKNTERIIAHLRIEFEQRVKSLDADLDRSNASLNKAGSNKLLFELRRQILGMVSKKISTQGSEAFHESVVLSGLNRSK